MAAHATALWKLDASAMSRALAAGELSSVELVRAHLDRIADADRHLHAFTAVFRDQALRDAARADEERRRGDARGPLHGLPISIKECFDFAGQATTLGVSAKSGHRAPHDAAMVHALRDAGAIVLGRTNLSQFMFYVESRNPLFGQTDNPWSAAHTPGGSSGGEAAAIAAGMSPLGLGTDIGGSIRVPAHFSGIAGLKPTLDRFPARGCATALPGQEVVRAQGGPLARTVADLALFCRALDGRRLSPLDPRVPPIDAEAPENINLKGLRVGVYTDDGFLPPSRAVLRAVLRAGHALSQRGCDVVPFAPPAMVDAIFTYLGAFSSDGAVTLDRQLRGGELDVALRSLKRVARMPGPLRHAAARIATALGETHLGRLLEAVGEKPVAELWRLTNEVRLYRFRLLDALDAARIDAVLCPPFATAALPHRGSADFTLAGSYSMLWNLVQFPAGVVPVTRVRSDETTREAGRGLLHKKAVRVDGMSSGLPVGVQVVGRPWAEATVLALMAGIEGEVKGEAEFPRTPVI